MAAQPNPNFGPAYAQCMWLLLFVIIANALVGLAISVFGQDVCSIARSGIRSAWPPNESFVSVSDLTNKHICNTVIVRSTLGCSLLLWLVVSIYKTARYLTPHFEPVPFTIVIVMGVTSYWGSGLPAMSGLHYYRVGLEDWWWVGFLKSGLVIVLFYGSSLWTIYIILCAFRKYR
jgi:hypothetical protein